MQIKWWLMISLVVFFLGGKTALAHGGDQPLPFHPHGQEHSEHELHEMDMGEGIEGTDSHAHDPVTEQPANLPLLGAFAAVNLFFILIGIWNKWVSRKEDSDATVI